MSYVSMPLEFSKVQSAPAQNLSEAAAPQEESSLYSDYRAWQNQSDINEQVRLELVQEFYDAGKLNENILDIINGIWLDEQEKIGLEFDFMQGADVNDEEAYDKQTLELANGKFEAQDKDGDGKISLAEFLDGELGSDIAEIKYLVKNGELSKEDAKELLTEASLLALDLFSIIDTAMGNNDGSLDASEFQTYYQYLDGWTGTPGESNRDGKFFASDEQEYNEYLTAQIKNNDNQREVMRKYAASKIA